MLGSIWDFNVLKKRKESEVKKAKERIQYLWDNLDDGIPVIIGYSGGKDSTLLLELTLEVSRENDFNHEVIAHYSNTGYDSKVKVAHIEQEAIELNKLKNTRFCMTHPQKNLTILSLICGRGYPAPSVFNRYCAHAVKLEASDRFEREIANTHGGALILVGERKEESLRRHNRLNKEGAPDALVRVRQRPFPIYKCSPIADVKTDEVWSFFDSIEQTVWGTPISKLKEFYSNKRGRDGCWICTVASEKGFADQELATGRIRMFLRQLNDDPTKRCICSTPKQKEKLESGIAAGKFTQEARREFYNFVKEQERLSGETFISAEEDAFIHDCWNKGL